MRKIILGALFFAIVLPLPSYAGDEVINQLRFFYGQNNLALPDANAIADASGINQLKKFDRFGIEAARDVGNSFNLGLRLELKSARTKPIDPAADGTYFMGLMQSSALIMATVPFVKGEKFKLEAFTGLGASSTTLSLKASGQDGQFSRGGSAPTAIFGAAVAYGYKYVFLKLEAGYEYNKVSQMDRTGTLTSTLDSLDLSGAYFNVGILIDGLKLGRL